MVHIFTYDFEWSVSFLHLWVHVYFVILTTYLRGAAAMCPVVASNGVGWEWTSRLPLVTESNSCAQRITIVTPTENQTVPYHNHTLAIVNFFSNKLLLFSPADHLQLSFTPLQHLSLPSRCSHYTGLLAWPTTYAEKTLHTYQLNKYPVVKLCSACIQHWTDLQLSRLGHPNWDSTQVCRLPALYQDSVWLPWASAGEQQKGSMAMLHFWPIKPGFFKSEAWSLRTSLSSLHKFYYATQAEQNWAR